MDEQRTRRDAELLGYRPILKPDLKRQSDSESIASVETTETFSPVLTQLQTRTPYLTCKNVENKISVLEECLTNVENRLSPMSITLGSKIVTLPQLQQLILTKPTDVDLADSLNEWRDALYSDINGEFGLEVYEQLSLCLQQLTLLRDLYYRLNYHDQSTIEEQMADEKQMILRLEELERTNQEEKINYAAVSVDVQLSEGVLNLSQALYGFGLSLYNSYSLGLSADAYVSPDHQEKLQTVFERYVETQLSDIEKNSSYTNRTVMGTLLESIQSEKTKFLNVTSVKQNLGYAMQEDQALSSYYQKSKTEMYRVMKEFYLFSKSIEQNYGDLLRSTTEKERFKQIFIS